MGGDGILFHEIEAMCWVCSRIAEVTNEREIMIFRPSVLVGLVSMRSTNCGSVFEKNKSIFPEHVHTDVFLFSKQHSILSHIEHV